jgi:hypothetical protein
MGKLLSDLASLMLAVVISKNTGISASGYRPCGGINQADHVPSLSIGQVTVCLSKQIEEGLQEDGGWAFTIGIR